MRMPVWALMKGMAVCKIADSVFIPSPQRVLKLRRWSLGLRRWMRGRTRQGEPGEEGIWRFNDLAI